MIFKFLAHFLLGETKVLDDLMKSIQDDEEDDLEAILRPLCGKMFGAPYESLSGEEKKKAFYTILRRYLLLKLNEIIGKTK